MLRLSIASHWIIATRVFPSERQCSVFGAIWASRIPLSQQVNGNAPFCRAFFGVFGDIERICSVFQAVFKPIFDSKVGGLNRSEWVGMLRFRHNTSRIDLSYKVKNALYYTKIVSNTELLSKMVL